MEPKQGEPSPGAQGEDVPAEVYFARELATYARFRSQLERNHLHQVALIHGDDLIGVFSDLIKAVNEGRRRFGLEKYMVYEIGDPVYEVPLLG